MPGTLRRVDLVNADGFVDCLALICRGVLFLGGNIGGLVAEVFRNRFGQNAIGTKLLESRMPLSTGDWFLAGKLTSVSTHIACGAKGMKNWAYRKGVV